MATWRPRWPRPRVRHALHGLLAVVSFMLPKLAASQEVRTEDLLPYLSDAPPTTQVAVQLCNCFKIVEKPYYVLFTSCWICAVLQQITDATRYLEERNEELGRFQKGYVAVQLVTLVTETYDLLSRIEWLGDGGLWNVYNLYVYMFVHSAVFVRSVMMSMIIWDWYEAKLLKRAVFNFDGKGWSDIERAFLLVFIMQFGSSAFVMGLVFITHLIPGLVLYHWVFLLIAAFIIKVRTWIRLIGLDPEGRVGRGLVMASNSFVAVAGLQMLITSIIRVYAGQWSQFGYMMPIQDDLTSRHFSTWYECHLGGKAGISGALKDQDFLNLFVR